ncbi:MAG: hypothetical protein WAX38_03220 [Minisyncoccia bacterium]
MASKYYVHPTSLLALLIIFCVNTTFVFAQNSDLVQVVYPNGGQTISDGKRVQVKIKLDASLIKKMAKVRNSAELPCPFLIELYAQKIGDTHALIDTECTGLKSLKSDVYSIPMTLTSKLIPIHSKNTGTVAPGRYKVNVSLHPEWIAILGKSLVDDSDTWFTFASDGTALHKITYPTQGYFKRGKEMRITWKNTGIPSDSTITLDLVSEKILSDGAQERCTIIGFNNGDRLPAQKQKYIWLIPALPKTDAAGANEYGTLCSEKGVHSGRYRITSWVATQCRGKVCSDGAKHTTSSSAPFTIE